MIGGRGGFERFFRFFGFSEIHLFRPWPPKGAEKTQQNDAEIRFFAPSGVSLKISCFFLLFPAPDLEKVTFSLSKTPVSEKSHFFFGGAVTILNSVSMQL